MVDPSSFEWRAALGSWRWLILGAIGAGAACGGRAGSESQGADEAGQGGEGALTSGVNLAGAGGAPAASGRGGAGARGGATGVSGGGNPAPTPSVCEDELALEGGLQRCTNGVIHRPRAVACSIPSPLPELIPELVPEGLPDAGAGRYACLENADCTDKPYGLCRVADYLLPYCSYGCATDADCASDQFCNCSGLGGECRQASCRTDSDCRPGHLCATISGCSTQYVCTTDFDQCLTDADCPSGSECELAELSEINPLASPVTGQYRKCAPLSQCPIPGRPFLVEGIERVAPAVARSDWSSRAENETENESAPSPAPAPELCAALARGWTEQALMEHASVAAFARFTLQLLSLGAPAELVARSAEAMGDEIRHARDCFRLARRYSQSELGPGPLPVAGALEQSELCDVVLGTLREGCVGETVAAIEAAEALQHCADVEARAVLERIAAEETRHAELAWRFVAWALDSCAEPTRTTLLGRIRAALAEELGAPSVLPAIGEHEHELARQGLLGPALRQMLRARVLREVVAPCAEAWLGSALPGAAAQPGLADVDVVRRRAEQLSLAAAGAPRAAPGRAGAA